MARAILNGIILADSETYEDVEGNIYFPKESVNMKYLEKSNTQYSCHWKGHCQYYNITIDDLNKNDSAWSYDDPKPDATHIKGHIAFAKSVNVEV